MESITEFVQGGGGFWDTNERKALQKEWEKAQAAARVATQQQPPSSPQVTQHIGRVRTSRQAHSRKAHSQQA